MSQQDAYKSVATALIFSVLLGPIGLLYASFWGGFIMTVFGVIFISGKFGFLTFVLWLTCCIWSVGAVEAHNKKLRKV